MSLNNIKQMKLLTQAIRKKLPPLYSNEKIGMKARVIVKFFNPYGNQTWYITEFDGEDQFFGMVDLGFGPELGYFSLKEIQEVRTLPFNMPLERDMYWDDETTLEDVKNSVRI